MSTRNRNAAASATAVPVVEPRSARHALQRLQFDEPLSWRAGKPIPIADLLRRLMALSKELRDMVQEETDRDSLTRVAKELTGHGLLSHKDKGVRAWTACCLVDILKLCAPDAPYTGTQLKDIFTLIITSVLLSLSDPSNAYNSQHTYVLQSLAQVKSIVLLTDIPSSETLILQLFTSFFDILSGSSKASTGEQIGKNVEYHMTEVLVILVDEAAHLPLAIVDIILAQFLRADPRIAIGGAAKGKRSGAAPVPDVKQSTLLMKELPPAYNMARTICNTCPEKMARYVSQYFNDVIVDASAAVNNGAGKGYSHRRISNARVHSDDEDDHTGPTEEDLKELQKAHRLLRELWRASPAVLQNVVPQLEAELSAENVQLRLLATETLGDMVSGIGAAGPPPSPAMDPTKYPPQRLEDRPEPNPASSLLTTPSSLQPFPQVHPAAYHSFLSRRHDKSALIRAAWATAISRVLSTSAGGAGLSTKDEQQLLQDLAATLADADERVRVAAVKGLSLFTFQDVVSKLGSIGGVEKEGSVLSILAGRARDRKHAVRVEGMMILGRIWGVAAGEIASGNKAVTSALGAIPSKIFDTFYVNDLDINALLDYVLFELLLPLDFPPSKSKTKAASTSQSRLAQQDDTSNTTGGDETVDWDFIRTERMLHLVKSLDAKAKKAFFAVQARRVQLASIMSIFLKRCEEYNGGVMTDNEVETKSHLTGLIQYFSKMLPDSAKAGHDLWRFVKTHDRRNYQLVKFCMDPVSDYRTVVKAIKELRKRITTQPGSTSASVLDTLNPLLYRSSLLVYNKSHISAILRLSRVHHTLGPTAHEVLKEISARNPEVFKAHVNELCRLLQDQTPTAAKPNEVSTLDTLKACAAFATRYPKEMTQDRKFFQSITDYALYGAPPKAAKYAVSIILATSERKEMHAKDLLKQCIKGFKYGSKHFLTQLAALSQLVLLASEETQAEVDASLDIALKEVLLQFRTPARADQPAWVLDEEVDEECQAKLWALRILVNSVRSHNDDDDKTLIEAAQPVFRLLNTLIAKGGESSEKQETPAPHQSRLRLAAAQLMLKLCASQVIKDRFAAKDFDQLALMAQDSVLQVRSAFMRKLKKYLGQDRLSPRFYPIVFLQAFEPQTDIREDTVTWIRSRSKYYTQQQKPTMETVLARLLSLLAHHPDFDKGVDDLADFTKYILFYLGPVATEENLALIYCVAQQLKLTRDAVYPDRSENLYCLSDLTQAIIRRYENVHGWSMQAWPYKVGLPSLLFRSLTDPKTAQEIANKSYLPEGLDEKLDVLVRANPKSKRKSEGHKESTLPSKKRAKSTATVGGSRTESGNSRAKNRTATTVNKKKKKNLDEAWKNAAHLDDSVASGERRSGRRGKVVTYAENSDSEGNDDDKRGDDEEMEDVHDHQEESDIAHDHDSDNIRDGDDRADDNQREDEDLPGQMDEQTSPSSVVPLRPRRTATARSSTGRNHIRVTINTAPVTTATKSESLKGKHHFTKTVRTANKTPDPSENDNDSSNDNGSHDNDDAKAKEEVKMPKRNRPSRSPKNETRDTKRLSRKFLAVLADSDSDSDSGSTPGPIPVGVRNTRATTHILRGPKSPPPPPPTTTKNNNNKLKDGGDRQKGRRANGKGKGKEDVVEGGERDLLATSESDELSDPPPSDQEDI